METEKKLLDDWETLLTFLPEGWREKAKEKGAIRRARGITDPEVLLRIFLVHLAQGYSLKETEARVRESGTATITSVGIYKRLRRSAEWLRWMAQEMLEQKVGVPAGEESGLRIRMVDGTTVSEPGSTGSDWRLHYALQLKPLRCDHFGITDVHEGESLRNFPVRRGDLILGDRGYADAGGIAHVAARGGEALVRMRMNSFRLRDHAGRRFRRLKRLGGLRVGRIGDWPVRVEMEGGGFIPGRVCALRKSKAAAEVEIVRLRRKYSKQRSGSPGERALAGAHYVCIFTTVDGALLPAREVMELYRARWQIELAFRRLKSIFNFGHLPKNDPLSARAWLYGKLLVALLAESIVETAHSISPWGYVRIG